MDAHCAQRQHVVHRTGSASTVFSPERQSELMSWAIFGHTGDQHVFAVEKTTPRRLGKPPPGAPHPGLQRNRKDQPGYARKQAAIAGQFAAHLHRFSACPSTGCHPTTSRTSLSRCTWLVRAIPACMTLGGPAVTKTAAEIPERRHHRGPAQKRPALRLEWTQAIMTNQLEPKLQSLMSARIAA